MQWIATTDLARKLGLSDRTIRDWCADDPSLAHKEGFVWSVNIRRLAEAKRIDLVDLLLLLQSSTSVLVKASQMAKDSRINRRTVAHWCKTRPGFAIRIGHVWFVDIGRLGVTKAEIAARRREQDVSEEQ